MEAVDSRQPTTPAPTVGRIVHYVSFGTPGGEYPSTCLAALVTEVADSSGECTLATFYPNGMAFKQGVPYDDGAETPGAPDCDAPHDIRRYCPCGWVEAHHRAGTWHWPERA